MEENIMNPTTNIEKPKRKYTRRKKADSTEPVESEVVENISKE